MNKDKDEKWNEKYDLLKQYVASHHHLPDKHRIENRGLLNWWKYQMKKKKAGTLPPDHEELLETLSNLRTHEHTGGRRKKTDCNPKEQASSQLAILLW